MSDTVNRGYPIPDPAAAIHPAVRDALVDIDADVQGIRESSVWSFNSRLGAVTLLPQDVITALGLLDDGTFNANDYPGLLRWYNPDTIGITTGTALSSWDDSSTAADPAVQATGTKQPIFHSTGGPNNKQRVVFDGSNDFLQFTELTTVRTVYLVVKHRTGDQPANSPVLLGHNTGFPYQGQTGTKLFTQSGAPSAVDNGQFFVNGELKDYYNELKSTNYQIYTIVSPSNATIKYLLNDRDVNFWDGDIVEWIVSSEVHSKTIRRLHEAYLADAARFDIDILTQSQPPASTKFEISGNSILASGTIVTQLLRACHPSNTQANWAVGGRTTQVMASSAPTSEDVGYDATKEYNVLIAMEITNDLANTDLSATDTTTAGTQAGVDIVAYYAARRAAHPSWKIVGVTAPSRNSNLTGTDMTPAAFRTMVLIANQYLRDHQAESGCDVICDWGADAQLGAWSTDKVGMVKITAGGTGYSASFAVTFTGGGGSGATGTATASGGVIQSVAMTNYGSGYTSAPTPDFSAGGGSGATATAYLGAGDMSVIGDGTHFNTAGDVIASRMIISSVGELDLGAEDTVPPETVNPGEVLMSTGFTASPVFGVAGTTRGSLGLSGSTSGVVTIRPAAAAGTWNLTLPTSGGSAGQFLLTDGVGVTSWGSTVPVLYGGSAVGSTLTLQGTSHASPVAAHVLINTVVSGVSPGGLFIGATAAGDLSSAAITDALHLRGGDAHATYAVVDSYGAGSLFLFRRAGGTFASPTATASGDIIVNLQARGYQTTTGAFAAGANARILMRAAEAFTSTAQGANISFDTVPIGSTTIAERMRITDAGNVKIGGTANRGTTEGTNQLILFDGTSPAGTLTNGISIYSRSGECYILDAAGNETIQSPHDKESGEWIYFSRNTMTGKVLRIEMEQLMKAVNKKLNTDFIQEYTEKVI